MRKILITGGTGLLGTAISKSLLEKGHEVCYLSRTENLSAEIKQYKWDIAKAKIDIKAFDGVTDVVHLAGAGVADKRWTANRKTQIADSRIASAQLLSNTIIENELPVQNFISASAIGIYGNRDDEWLYENSAPENNWLADICQQWEAATDDLTEWGIRTANVRIGLVMANNGGALAKLTTGVKLGVNPILGDGKQYYSWIHIDDLVGIFIHLLNNENIIGPINAVAPEPVDNRTFTIAIQKAMGKKALNPKMPRLAMDLALGEMASVLFDSARVSADLIQEKGYQFKFEKIDKALTNLLSNA